MKGSHARVLRDVVDKYFAQGDKRPDEPVGRVIVILEERGPRSSLLSGQRTQGFWTDCRQSGSYLRLGPQHPGRVLTFGNFGYRKDFFLLFAFWMFLMFMGEFSPNFSLGAWWT